MNNDFVSFEKQREEDYFSHKAALPIFGKDGSMILSHPISGERGPYVMRSLKLAFRVLKSGLG
jgi:hypothetical protein